MKRIILAAIVGLLVSGPAIAEGETRLEQYKKAEVECKKLWYSFVGLGPNEPPTVDAMAIARSNPVFIDDHELRVEVRTISADKPSLMCHYNRPDGNLRISGNPLKIVRYRLYTQSSFQELYPGTLPIVVDDMVVKPN